MKDIKCYYSFYPKYLPDISSFPTIRKEDILNCKNIPLKLQKAWAWKLLEVAFLNEGIDVSNLIFYKNPKGKYFCNKYYFSITHTNGIVAVCLWENDCGIDIESLQRSATAERLIHAIYTEEQNNRVKIAEDKNFEFLKIWTEKESLYKTYSGRVSFSQTDINLGCTNTILLKERNIKYVLTVSAKEKFTVDYLKIDLQ